jgi:N-acetylmuramoyl-L-alanine amidase
MGELIIAGERFDIDAPLVNWYQSGWDATKEYCVNNASTPDAVSRCANGITPYGEKAKNRRAQRYSLRAALRQYGKNPPLAAVKSVIRQFVLHHDGCASATMCWNVLHNERGLSCHFLVDNDGTIYQTIDLALNAFHAGDFNRSSIGVEFCNRGDAKKEPEYYSRKGIERPTKACKINGHTYLSYDFTSNQYYAFDQLVRALTRLLPNLPMEYPQSAPGEQSWDTMPYASGFSGYLGHYHATRNKWDPGPFDFKAFCKKQRGTFCMPMFTRDDPTRAPTDKPEIPASVDELRGEADALYKANEQHADGGFFPVGPWGTARLWHGGVHVTGKERAPLFAPFPGRVVAARMGGTSAVGSTNFVLLRHDMTLGTASVRFFSLYMHLTDELGTPEAERPSWMTGATWLAGAAARAKGAVALLDEPVEAGQVIGRLGKAGPPGASRAQVHLEIFSTSPLFENLPATPWTFIDGTAGGRFCDVAEINDVIDTNDDGELSGPELAAFYAGGGDDTLRYSVALHVSEWTPEPSWKEALRVPADFQDLPPAELDAMVDEQITPALWWTAELARHARLPADGVVYHYHPVTFLRWFNEELLEAAASGITVAADASEASATPTGVTDDFGDETGADAVSDADLGDDTCDKELGLEQLVQGWDAPECAP